MTANEAIQSQRLYKQIVVRIEKCILEAVSRHDPRAAAEAMRAHLRQVREDTGASNAT